MNKNSLLRNFFRVLIVAVLVLELVAVLKRTNITAQFSWELLFVTLVISWGGLELVNYLFRKWYSIKISPFFWFLIIVPIGFDLAGGVFYLFDSIPTYDVFMHLIGGGLTVGILSLLVVSRINRMHSSPLTQAMVYYIAVSSAVFVGFIYEVIEYFFDVFKGTHNLTSSFDTTEDMILNFLGAVFVVAVHRFAQKIKNTNQAPPLLD